MRSATGICLPQPFAASTFMCCIRFSATSVASATERAHDLWQESPCGSVRGARASVGPLAGGVAEDGAEDAHDGLVGVHSFAGAAGRFSHRGVGDAVELDGVLIVAAGEHGAIGPGPLK